MRLKRIHSISERRLQKMLWGEKHSVSVERWLFICEKKVTD